MSSFSFLYSVMEVWNGRTYDAQELGSHFDETIVIVRSWLGGEPNIIGPALLLLLVWSARNNTQPSCNLIINQLEALPAPNNRLEPSFMLIGQSSNCKTPTRHTHTNYRIVVKTTCNPSQCDFWGFPRPEEVIRENFKRNLNNRFVKCLLRWAGSNSRQTFPFS